MLTLVVVAHVNADLIARPTRIYSARVDGPDERNRTHHRAALSFPACAAPSQPPGGRRPHTAMVMADMVAKAGSFNRASASSTSSAMIALDLIAKPAVFWIARR